MEVAMCVVLACDAQITNEIINITYIYYNSINRIFEYIFVKTSLNDTHKKGHTKKVLYNIIQMKSSQKMENGVRFTKIQPASNQWKRLCETYWYVTQCDGKKV